MRRFGYIAFACGALALIAGGYLLYKTGAKQSVTPPASVATSTLFGFIRSAAIGQRGAIVLRIDEAEMLTGSDAIAQASLDTGCPPKTVSDCIPSLNNDFYIRNLSTSTKEYTLSPGASVLLLMQPGGPDLSTSTPEQFVRLYPNPALRLAMQPFHFTARGDAIVSMEEQYTP